jgi:ABC-type nitrate/sulfonate/bicarbonate transport system substrate-binding protein
MKRTYPWLLAFLIVLVGILAYTALRLPTDWKLSDPVPLRVQLQWFDQAQFMGFYVAHEKRYYKDDNLDVKLIAGGFAINPIVNVRQGAADIGIATGDQVLLAEANGSDLKAIGTVFDTSLACFMSMTAAHVTSPKDFVGHTVGVYRGFDTENILLALLNGAQVPVDRVHTVQAGDLSAFPDSIDVFPSYSLNEPIAETLQGRSVTCLKPDAFGVHFYGDTLFTTAAFWRNNRDALKRFLEASSRGWEFCALPGNEDKALDLMYQYSRNLSKEDTWNLQKGTLQEALRHVGAGPNHHPFFMEQSRWKTMEAELIAAGRLGKGGYIDNLCDFTLVN